MLHLQAKGCDKPSEIEFRDRTYIQNILPGELLLIILPVDLLQLEHHLRLVRFEVHRQIFHNLKLVLHFRKCSHQNLTAKILL